VTPISGGILAGNYGKKCNMILDHEYSSAKSVALALIKPKPLTVWDVMLPMIFILNFIKLKQSREVFIQNQIFTNTLAAEAIRDIFQKQQPKAEAMAAIRVKTREMLSTIPGGIYSEDIRREQLKEIECLMDHYYRLFQVDGADYPGLVRNAYKRRSEYSAFFDKLKAIEKEVMIAAQRTLGEKADLDAARRLEELTEKVRAAEIQNIFNSE
jgi:hypothetical protein